MGLLITDDVAKKFYYNPIRALIFDKRYCSLSEMSSEIDQLYRTGHNDQYIFMDSFVDNYKTVQSVIWHCMSFVDRN